MESYKYRPLNEREKQRMQAEVPYPGGQAGYPASINRPYWANPGYDYRQTDQR